MSRYKERDTEDQGQYYFNHVDGMTRENLHSKSKSAAALAHRDVWMDRLMESLMAVSSAAHKFDTRRLEAEKLLRELEEELIS